jgi:hypothetical protein
MYHIIMTALTRVAQQVDLPPNDEHKILSFLCQMRQEVNDSPQCKDCESPVLNWAVKEPIRRYRARRSTDTYFICDECIQKKSLERSHLNSELQKKQNKRTIVNSSPERGDKHLKSR